MAFAGDVTPPASAALHQFDLDFLQGPVERKRWLVFKCDGLARVRADAKGADAETASNAFFDFAFGYFLVIHIDRG